MKKWLIFFHIAIAIVLCALIAYLNLRLIAHWFSGEFNQNLDSIEISYIQMAKFWVENASSGWQSLWYLGYPWHVFYTPLLPALEVLTHWTLDFSFAHAYRVITGAGYVLVPVALYLFVWQVSKSKTGALLAAMIYSFAPSVISFLFAEVAADSTSGLVEPRRFTILVRWGEGPHTLALVFVPLFGLTLSRYLEGRKFFNLLFASVFLGLVALTNAIALWACFLLAISFFLCKISATKVEPTKIIGDFLLLFVMTFGLVAFWYNLPFAGTFFKEGSGALTNWLALFPWGLLPLGALFLAIFLVIKKLALKFPNMNIALPIYWFLMLFALVYIYYASGENRLEYVPQVLRLNTEVDMAASLLIGVVVSNLFLFLNSRPAPLRLPAQILAMIVISLPMFFLVLQALRLLEVLPEKTKSLAQSAVGDIKNTAEYRVSQRLKEMTKGTNQRVFAPGNYGFWLNFFVPVPQLRGALFQSSTHYWPDHIYFQVTNGQDANISLAWLTIANVGKLVYTTGGSREPYKDYRVPVSKFNAVLKEIGNEAGDVYFEVPLKNDSLAKIVDAKAAGQLKKPFNAIDEEPIYKYLAWLEAKSDRRLDVAQIKNDRWRINGEIASGEAILFAQTYDNGWQVKPRPGSQIKHFKKIKDPLDFLLLVPGESGKFEVDVVYAKPWSVYLGYLITLLTVGWMIKRLVRECKV